MKNSHDDKVIRPLVIGNVTLPNNLILGPMAGVTNLPFRLLCQEMGAGLCCAEMVSAKALYYRNKNTKALLHTSPEENYVSLQLFGSDPECMGEMAKVVEELPFSFIDINMGCPVPKVVKNGDGCALMKEPLLAGKIIEAVVSRVKKPVTVKIRKGFDEAHVNAVELARIAEASGAAAVTVHGRTREQYYAGKADWEIIAAVKDAVHIPVIGNGDLHTAEDVLSMAKMTRCDGFMVARASRGNPWVFREMLCALQDGGEEPVRPTNQEVAATMLRHARMLVEEKGERTGIREMRMHAAWYTAGMRGGSSFRREVNKVETFAELEALVGYFLDNGE